MGNEIKAVLFDFDGTVADTGRGVISCVKKTLAFYGIEENDPVRLLSFIGPPLVDSFMALYGLDESRAQEFVKKYREYYSGGGVYETEVYAGIPEVLARLSAKGIAIGIASSKPDTYVKLLLEYLGIDRYFSFISAPEMGTVNPTKCQLIQKALTALNVSKDECVMVGDRLFDIDGGTQAGVRTIGAAYGYGGQAELEEHGATRIAHTTTEIAELIESI